MWRRGAGDYYDAGSCEEDCHVERTDEARHLSTTLVGSAVILAYYFLEFWFAELPSSTVALLLCSLRKIIKPRLRKEKTARVISAWKKSKLNNVNHETFVLGSSKKTYYNFKRKFTLLIYAQESIWTEDIRAKTLQFCRTDSIHPSIEFSFYHQVQDGFGMLAKTEIAR